MRPDWMLTILAAGSLLVALSFWRAHRKQGFNFNAFDLIMEGGKVSKTALAFMLVLAVTTWVIVDLQIKGHLTEAYFGAYGVMWVGPLVARVIFGKTDMPSGTTITTSIQSTEKTTP